MSGKRTSAAAPSYVRKLLREAESFSNAGGVYGATARARQAAVHAATISSDEGVDVRQEVSLVLHRLEAAEEAARREVEQRHALHVANERRAAGITAEAPERRSPPRGGLMAALVRWARRKRPWRRASTSMAT